MIKIPKSNKINQLNQLNNNKTPASLKITPTPLDNKTIHPVNNHKPPTIPHS